MKKEQPKFDSFKAHRIIRKPRTGAHGSNLRHQYAFSHMEPYVFIPEKRYRTLGSSEVHVVPAVMRERPVFHHITHLAHHQ